MDDDLRRRLSRRSMLRLGAAALAAGAAVGASAWRDPSSSRAAAEAEDAVGSLPAAGDPTGPALDAGLGPQALAAVPLATPSVRAGSIAHRATTHTTSAATAQRNGNEVDHARRTRRKPGENPAWARGWSAPISSTEDYNRHCPEQRQMPHDGIMLTIDDGPSPEWTPKFLRLLRDLDITATFSLIGEEVAENPRLVHDIVYRGHAVSNHTWTHPENLPYLSPERIHDEIARTQRAIIDAGGVRPHLFRAPGGVWGPRVYHELRVQELMPLGWDIDPRDWSLPGVDSIESAMLAAGPRDIILCHDGGGDRSETYDALRYVLPRLKRRGLKFVTLPYLPL